MPTIDAQGSITRGNQMASEAARGFGAGAAGVQRQLDDNEYAKILGDYQGRQDRYNQLSQELAQLKARNAEIAKQLGM